MDREFVKNFQEKVATYCYYMMPADTILDDLLIAIFREYGEDFRKQASKSDGTVDPLEQKIRLFRTATEMLTNNLTAESVGWSVGRDIRKLKAMDENILRDSQRLAAGDDEAMSGDMPEAMAVEIGHRLRSIDTENRAAMILKDILGFEDEEVLRMLSLRWGVYRHRLHRARLDLCVVLEGASAALASDTGKSDGDPVSW